MTKPTLDSLLLHFCLVRTKNILRRLISLLFFHCSRTIDPIAPLLLSTLLLRLSVLNVVLQKKVWVETPWQETTSSTFA